MVGYGSTCDAHHITAPDPDGEGGGYAIQLALDEAGYAGDERIYINAHGTSTPRNDSTETKAIKYALGDAAYRAIVGGIGFLDGMPVTCITMNRGDSIEDRIMRNFGCPSPEGYRKALRLTANDLYRMKVSDGIIPETYKTVEETARVLKKRIAAELAMLNKVSIPRLLASRYEKFRAIGAMQTKILND